MTGKIIFLAFFTILLGEVQAQKSLKFDGVNDEVQISGYRGITGRGARTIEAWVKFSSNATNDQIVVWGTNSTGQKWTIRLDGSNGNALRAEINGGNIIGSTNLKDSKWHHVAVVWSNDGSPNISDAKLYVDGVREIIAKSNSRSLNTGNGAIVKLGNGFASNQSFEGQMDEVRIWSAALTEARLRDWMCKEVISSHPDYSNLQGYWKMDTLAGTTLKDYKGSRNGSIRNGASWQNDGGPIGTASIHRYSSSAAISLKHLDGDSAVVSGWTGKPEGVHLYRRDARPNHSGLPSLSKSIDSSRHYGVFVVKGSSPTYKLDYYYSPNKHYVKYGACSNYLLSRADNSVKTWSMTTASNTAGTFSLSSQKPGEYLIGYGTGGVIITAPNNKDTSAICSGDSIQLSNSTTGFTYQWLRNGSPISGATQGTLTTADSGLYNLIIVGGSCSDTSNTLTLLTKNNPVVTLSGYSAVCASEFSIPFAGGSPSGGTYTSPYASGNIFVIKSAGPGFHKITYEYVDQFGCRDTASQQLEVLNLPQVSLAPKLPVCLDSSSHNLTGGMPTGGIYSINGTTSVSFDATSLGSGKHWIKYTYTDSNNCASSDSNEAEVLALPNVVLSLIKNSFCEYDKDWTLDGQNPSGGVYNGNGVNGFDFSPTKAGAGSHEISYTVTDNITGCKNAAKDTIVVTARPAKPAITQVGDSLKVTPAFDHRWFTLVGGVPGATSSSIRPAEEGEYYARVQNKEGCWSLNSDTIFYKPTGVNELNSDVEVTIYPNPSSGILQFRSFNPKMYQFRVVSIEGKEVLNGSIKNDEEIDLNSIKNGIYFVHFTDKNNGIKSLRLILHK
ncbi:MAG: hypothetical protein CL840_20070 [Crocinitomicaceae bacterium]|nr:hypothetical protein [Crocinitomicaceae bacterium]|tara:strand:- start:78 stop:2594 length:2517 start_codon:yes stop_codon:yes gene_type:complete